MAKIYKSIEELIGDTPLLKLSRIEKEIGYSAHLLAKIEKFNPAGSIKDRAALNIIEEAEASGLIGAGSIVIEPTSGNTGIGLAAICAARGYKAVIVMPDTMSRERQLLMKAYGAKLVLSDGALGMKGAIAKAEEIQAATPGSIIAGQFVNSANPDAHYKTTGPEIVADTDGEVAALVCGIGTGGTITGVGRFLKENVPGVKIFGVEPEGSPFLTEGRVGKHNLQGIGAGFKPDILDMSVVDEVLTITDEEAYQAGRALAASEGLLCGITSGAAVAAAMGVAMRPEFAGKNIVVILPDTGERYLSTKMFE